MPIEVVVAAVVVTQLCYFVVDCGLLGLFVRRPANEVDERTLGRVLEAAGPDDSRGTRAQADGGLEGATGRDATARAARRTGTGGPETPTRTTTGAATTGSAVPTRTAATDRAAEIQRGPGPRCRLPADLRPRIRVFVPLVGDRRGGLGRTLESIAAQSYPAGAVTVSVVYEASEQRPPELAGAMAGDRPPGLAVEPIAIDPADLAADRSDRDRWFAGTGAAPATAAALTAAYDRSSVAADDVLTAVEPGTWLPVDTFELAVAGLEEYDVVQAKRTAFDVDAGILPLLESTATAAWSDLAYASSKGPYHLLESGFFLRAAVAADVDRWRRETDAAVPLGVAASRRGYSLGVCDRYVRVPCPTGLRAWIREKRRWTGSLYRRLFGRGWAGGDDVRCWTGTLLLQALALISVVGLPAAALLAVLSASGAAGATLSLPLRLVVGFNGLVWGYYGVGAVRAARDAVPFRSRPHRLAYSLLSNPLSQALFAMLWAVPICLGLLDTVRGTTPSTGPSSR